jgi:hypothetical protein
MSSSSSSSFSPSPSIFDVVLIGGGVAAVESARRLLDKGLTVRLIDKGSMERDPEKPHDLASGIMGAGTFSDGKYSFFPAGTKIWELRDKAIILRALLESIDELNAAHEATKVPLPVHDNNNNNNQGKLNPINFIMLLALVHQMHQGFFHAFLSLCMWTVLGIYIYVWLYRRDNRVFDMDLSDASTLVICAIGCEWWHPGYGFVLAIIGCLFARCFRLFYLTKPCKRATTQRLPRTNNTPLFDTAALISQVEEHFRALSHHDAEPSILADTTEEAWKFKAYTSIYLPLVARLKLVRDASTLLAPHALMEHVVHNVTRSSIDGIYEIAYQVGGTCAARACKRAGPFPPSTPQDMFAAARAARIPMA